MGKTQRRVLVLVLIFSFFIVTPAIIFYSQGYRFDWHTKKLTQTGGFYFKAIPSRVDILLNGNFVKKTDFLFDSTLISNLLPKSYTVQIEKGGYLPWTKVLSIQPKEVTEARNIVLFPTKISFQMLFENIKDFWPAPDGTKIVLQKATPGQKWQLYLWNSQTNDQRLIVKQKNNEDVFAIVWSQDSSRILLQTVSTETIVSSVWNLTGSTNDSCVQNSCAVGSLGQTLNSIMFSPENNDEIFYLSDSQLLQKESYVNSSRAPQTIAHNVVSFTVNSQNLMWLDGGGTL